MLAGGALVSRLDWNAHSIDDGLRFSACWVSPAPSGLWSVSFEAFREVVDTGAGVRIVGGYSTKRSSSSSLVLCPKDVVRCIQLARTWFKVSGLRVRITSGDKRTVSVWSSPRVFRRRAVSHRPSASPGTTAAGRRSRPH